MAASLDRVVAQMMSLGMPDISPHELKLNTRGWQRYGPKKKAYYSIKSLVSRNGREYFVGSFGFKGNGPYAIEYEGKELTQEEVAALARKREITAAREARQRAIDVQRAADRARATWREATIEGSSPYLERKLVPLGGGWVRYLGENVVVPMVWSEPEGNVLRGVQIIRPNGEKRFTSGMDKAGTCAVLGIDVPGAPILLAEGLATAASCWLALNRAFRVVVAFDAQNIKPVLERMRARYPRSPMLVCADDDYLTEGNPGRMKATAAARSLDRCGVVYPVFRGRAGRKVTDFNDLHIAEGLDQVRDQLRVALQWLGKF